MKKIFLFFTVIFLIFSTTLTKNSTKKIDYHIYETKENIRILRNKYEYVLLDFNYLSSPKKLMEYQAKYFDKDLIPVNVEEMKQIKFKDNKIFSIVTKNNLNE